MDREPEELQFLGFFGTFREAQKLVLSWRHLFAQIALALVFPLALISLAHIEISHLLFSEIIRNKAALDSAPAGSPAESRLLSRFASEWAAVLLFKAVYLVGVLVFSLLSTSAVVYTVASVYTGKDLTFRKVLSVVPRVWKRLMATFLWAFLLLFLYNAATILLVIISVLLIGPIVVLSVIALPYLAGLVWISVVWHVASVVSVLEDTCGVAAMRKSRLLVRGKLGVAAGIFLVLNLSFMGIEAGFRRLVVEGRGGAALGAAARAGYGALMLSLLSMLILIGLVVQTVVYFVCKSYHHESIDKSSLADHLEGYLGEYVPLKGRDVQLEHFYV